MSDAFPRPGETCCLELWSVVSVPSSASSPYADPALARRCLAGTVFGHPNALRHYDGKEIQTGTIRGFEGRVVWSRRTAYVLGEPAPAYLDWLRANDPIPFDPENPIRLVSGASDV